MNTVEQSQTSMQMDFTACMDHLTRLPQFILFTTGRVGTDFFQSLLDSHPQVLLFNGQLKFHQFWRKSKCTKSEDFQVEDVLEEFAGEFIERFKSKYDYTERKDQLGLNYNQTIDLNVAQFKSYVLKLLEEKESNSRNVLLAIYGAYALCLGQDLLAKKILFHHEHNFEQAAACLKDFPDARILIMTRDPRANFVSGVLHWRDYDSSRDRQRHVYAYLKRILSDADILNTVSHEYRVLKIEDLGQSGIRSQVWEWLGIDYHSVLEESTWAGLLWHGDRLTKKKIKVRGFSENVLENNWQSQLSAGDKKVLSVLMDKRLKHYAYECRPSTAIDYIVVFFLIGLPLKFERRFWSMKYLQKCIKNKDYRIIISNFYFYLKRIILFYSCWWNAVFNKPFNHKYFSKADAV